MSFKNLWRRIACRTLPNQMTIYPFKQIRDYKTPDYSYMEVVLNLLLVKDPFENLIEVMNTFPGKMQKSINQSINHTDTKY